ncbi:hypothetical protein RvY_01832 [Ramazzottius varieornatus]|uniref:Uncharacterized protein n=1 Tax=Ramazzottius varieornatus TaxID=947166 RepID=A0A1D1USC2_RAMVA|nr:hypothetical protein RvY_01832 [Ramazzottius varieornatus]
MALPQTLTLMQLLTMSLKTPDYGVVNFRSLYVLLEYIIERMHIAHDRVNLGHRPSRELIRQAGRDMMADGDAVDPSDIIDYRDPNSPNDLASPQLPPSFQLTIGRDNNSDQARIAALEDQLNQLKTAVDPLVGANALGGFGHFSINIDGSGGTANAGTPVDTSVDNAPSSQRASLGPLAEAWQIIQMNARLNMLQQAMEVANAKLEEHGEAIAKLKNLKNGLVNFLRKWMINPDAAFRDALDGSLLSAANNTENFKIPEGYTKPVFVTWPALRSVLVDRQAEDAKKSMIGAEPINLSPRPASHGHPPMPTEKPKHNLATDHPPGEEGQVDEPLPSWWTHATDPNLPQAGKKSNQSAATTPVEKSDKAGNASYTLEPDKDVLDILVQIGRLVRLTQRFDKRLTRIEDYLSGLAQNKNVNKLNSAANEFKQSIHEERISDAASTTAGNRSGSSGTSGSSSEGSDNPDTSGTPQTAAGRSTYGFGQDMNGLNNTSGSGSWGATGGPTRSSSPAVNANAIPVLPTIPEAVQPTANGSRNVDDTHGLFAMGLSSPDDEEAARIRAEKDEATAAQIRNLQQLLEQQKRHFDKMQNRLNTLHSELAGVTGKLKEQATKFSAPQKHALVHPQFDSSKSEKTNSGSNGPSRAEFEIFCRACAENFAMIEVRLSELESVLRILQQNLENLQNQTHRLQHDKADENALMELLLPGDYLDNNIRNLAEKLDVELTSQVNDKDRQTEKWTKAMEMLTIAGFHMRFLRQSRGPNSERVSNSSQYSQSVCA